MTGTEHVFRQMENAVIYRFENVFRFKDVFGGDERYRERPRVLPFLTTFPDGSRAECERIDGVLDRKVNTSSQRELPHRRKWSVRRIAQFQEMRGHLISCLGYSQEPALRRKCQKARDAGLLRDEFTA